MRRNGSSDSRVARSKTENDMYAVKITGTNKNQGGMLNLRNRNPVRIRSGIKIHPWTTKTDAQRIKGEATTPEKNAPALPPAVIPPTPDPIMHAVIKTVLRPISVLRAQRMTPYGKSSFSYSILSAERNSPPTASQQSPNSPTDNSEPLGGTACSASVSGVLDALAYQQALPIKNLLEGSPEDREKARLDMEQRLLGMKSAIKDYFVQSQTQLS